MQHLSSVQIRHAEGNVLNDKDGSLFIEVGFLLVDVVEQAALVHELCDHEVLVRVIAHAHVENDVGVPEVRYQLHLF